MSTLNFVAPFSLQHCRERLQSRHEPATLLAIKGQTRLTVAVAAVDEQQYHFKLRKMQKSLLSRPMGSFISASGVLQKHDEFTTLVQTKIQVNVFSAGVQTLLTCLITAFFGYLLYWDNPAEATRILMGTSSVIVLIVCWLSLYIQIEANYLRKVLETALS